MIIHYESKTNKFIIHCAPHENNIVMGMPDRRFRKTARTWAAPALRRNIEYMDSNMSNPQMYSPEALAAFNDKRRELRQEPSGENTFPAWYSFKNPPLPFQKRGLNKFFPLDSAAIFYEQGLGKTYVSINLVTAWRMTNKIDAVVVFCPSSIKMVWSDELVKHCAIPFQPHPLVSGKYKLADKFIAEKSDFPWLIVGIEGMSQGSACDYVKKFMLSRRCAVIVDESSTIKTPNKIRTDAVISIGKLAKKGVILSGTSITQGLEDLYTQYKFLDPDIIGFSSYYSFRAHFCIVMNITVGYDDFGNEKTAPKVIGYQNEAEFISLIKPYTERVEKKDVPSLGIPAKNFTTRRVQMNPTQKRLYEEMKEDMMIEMRVSGVVYDDLDVHLTYDENGSIVTYETSSILEKALRLQQITGGHYPWDEGSKVVPVPIPGKNPKIEELMQMLSETTGKIIIWCLFRPEIELVARALEKKEIGYVEFHGGCKEDEKITAVHSFRNNPKIRVFLATRAAARGLTLIEASDSVYYSLGRSLDDYAQSQDRIHRIGQKYICNYTHLACEKSIDLENIKSLHDKAGIADLVYSQLKGDDYASHTD